MTTEREAVGEILRTFRQTLNQLKFRAQPLPWLSWIASLITIASVGVPAIGLLAEGWWLFAPLFFLLAGTCQFFIWHLDANYFSQKLLSYHTGIVLSMCWFCTIFALLQMHGEIAVMQQRMEVC